VKKFIVMAVVVCLGWVGSSQKVFAGPTPVSAQEMTQLNGLTSGGLLEKKAGGSFPGSPIGLVATEESALRHLEKGSSQLGALKAGSGDAGDLLVVVCVIVCCVLLLRIII